MLFRLISTIYAYIHEPYISLLSRFFCYWFKERDRDSYIDPKFCQIIYLYQHGSICGPFYRLNLSENIIEYLKSIYIPEGFRFNGLYVHSIDSFLLFTKGINLYEEDFDNIARLAVGAFLRELEQKSQIYTVYTISEIGFVVEELVLKFLKKPEMNTPDEIISYLLEFSKAAERIPWIIVEFDSKFSTKNFKQTKFRYNEINYSNNPLKIYFELLDKYSIDKNDPLWYLYCLLHNEIKERSPPTEAC